MKKLILILIVLLGAALIYPGTRPRVLEALRPVTKPLLDPVLGWSAESEMERISSELLKQERVRNRFPRSGEFARWIQDHMGADAETDPWENRYRLRVFPDSFVVHSAGPDREEGTDDDLRVTEMRERNR